MEGIAPARAGFCAWVCVALGAAAWDVAGRNGKLPDAAGCCGNRREVAGTGGMLAGFGGELSVFD